MTRILLTNDDGIHSPGLHVLHEALASAGEVTVVAPERNQSAVARSITIGKPLRLRRVDLGAGRQGIAVDGTPVDCVRVALLGAVGPRPDLVVSGINLGSNMGNDVSYSGTVGAALEACLHGLPGMAVSVESRTPLHLAEAGPLLGDIARQLIAQPLPAGVMLNVNLPDRSARKFKGVAVTSLGGASCHDRVVLISDDGLGGEYEVSCAREPVPSVLSDFDAVERGYVSLTPLQYELISPRGLSLLLNWPLDQMAVGGRSSTGRPR